LEEGELADDGDVAGDKEVSIVGDITAAMFELLLLDIVHQARNVPTSPLFRCAKLVEACQQALFPTGRMATLAQEGLEVEKGFPKLLRPLRPRSSDGGWMTGSGKGFVGISECPN